MEILTTITDFLSTYWPFITSIVGSFALLATITSNKTDNKIINVVLKVINFLGANFGKAKNDPKET